MDGCACREQPSVAMLSHSTSCLASMLAHQSKTSHRVSAVSPGNHGTTVTTPTIRDVLLLVWHVSSLTQEVATSQEALTLLNVSGHHEMVSRQDRDTKAPVPTDTEESENGDLVAMAIAEQITSICHNVLRIAGFVKPDLTSSASCLFVIHWCLSQAARQFHHDVDLYVSLLTWIKHTVVTSDTFRRQLLAETPVSKNVLNHLLNMYSTVVSASAKCCSGECVEKSRQMVNKLLNETFLSIFDKGTSTVKVATETVNTVGRISSVLKRKSFKAAFTSLSGHLASCSDVRESELNDVLSLLVIETWLGADAPLHFTEGIK